MQVSHELPPSVVPPSLAPLPLVPLPLVPPLPLHTEVHFQVTDCGLSKAAQ
jgi:hypothetical protein